MNAACPLCESTLTEKKFGEIMRCRGCSMMFADATGFSASETYSEEYFRGGIYRDYILEGPARTELFKQKLQLISDYLPREGRLLDVGCAAGFFLKLMSDRGYETYGVEISEYAARYAQDAMNLKVYRGELPEAHFPNGYFHIVTMWDVLEHLPNVLETLTECRRILRRDGTLVIETLNAGSTLAKVLGRRWPLFAPRYHLSYFSKDTLRMALERSGFTIVEMIPVQTYAKTLKGFRPVRYFTNACLRETLGRFLDDVVLVVSSRAG